ncbi:hypothetical protein [Natranaerofaba carboxydovora]|uniref:hypothetical protein n=1 Tax=Natranaerofaba carboxydovora TaxID=2742683 RepID=UPI001F12AF72|nr:hypothetical protein [Natranaerofaba carboxydovora]UMZ74445.1 hypothetical protein ACONDI_02037 [Natranaerofaba carboxydovora]
MINSKLNLNKESGSSSSMVDMIKFQSTKLKYQKTSLASKQVFPNNKGEKTLLKTSNTYANLSFTQNKIKMFQDKSTEYIYIQSSTLNIEIETSELHLEKNIEDTNTFPSSKEIAERIINFAKNLAGDDNNKIDLLEEAFEKGFSQAKRMLGGWLPDRCYDTYDIVKEKFDNWREVTETEI